MTLGIKSRASQVSASPSKVALSDDKTGREELERRCSQALLTILPLMRQIINHERELTNPSITVQQYSVLKVLQEQERLISELADLLKVSRPTMTRIIDGLEGRRRTGNGESNPRPKLVERVACQDDHRLVYARITEEGQVFLHHYRAQAEESITAILQHLNTNDLPTLLRSLETLAQAVQAKS